MPEDQTPSPTLDLCAPATVAESFDALLAALKAHALDRDDDFDRASGFIAKVRDLRTRFAAGRPVNDPRGGKAGAS